MRPYFREYKTMSIDLIHVDEMFVQPYWLVELENDNEAKKVLSRSVTLRYIAELWASADTLNDLHSQMKSLSTELIQPYTLPHLTFKIKVETFCNSQTQAEKVDKIEVINSSHSSYTT